MSGSCCPSPNEKSKPAKQACPECGKEGKTVQRITLGALLKPEARKRVPPGDHFQFCVSSGCGVVYFSNGMAPFRLEDLTVRVGQKVTEEPKPVCYCFGHTEQEVIEDVLKNNGKTNIPSEITAQVKAGNCFCEVTTPQGSCCLGNVSQAAKKGVALGQAKQQAIKRCSGDIE